MRLEEFDYDLPEHLIAQDPLVDRTDARLMIVDRARGTIRHHRFNCLPEILKPGDLVVINNSRVIPARLFGAKQGTGGKIEMVLLHPTMHDNQWEVLVKPGKRAKPGAVFEFGDGLMQAEILSVTPEGGRVVQFYCQGNFQDVLDRLGQVPLPPYIKKELEDPERYQTVYAKESGSVAAPTAGLHFTEALINDLKCSSVHVEELTLHVGLGTFRPVQVEEIEDHQMHAEYYILPEKTAKQINLAKDEGRKIIAVGTTVVRTLETCAREGFVKSGKGWTDIFIYPGYQFQIIDGLLTNFHLPKSTLLMLVSAFAGKELIMTAYQEAIEQEYRFFSFGDAMFIQ